MTNQDYKNQALAALKGNWPNAVIATVVYCLCASILVAPDSVSNFMALPPYITISSGLFGIFVYIPLSVGFICAFKTLLFSGDERITRNSFKHGFSDGGYFHVLWGYILMEIFIFLWTLLLIIPGLIKSFAYAMTPYILVDEPELTANQAIDKSKEMMKGHKFDLFYLYLSFIGWGFLCLFTLGIGFLWLVPYIETSQAAFYKDVKEQYENKAA
ncbi:MAG: DUF975 family protein [Bacteroidales bacterium]|nr:DUF975 family protein [Bacteroidales bacterium]